MDKYRIATNFYNQFIRLSDSKKEEFSRLTNKLLSVNYLCANKSRDRDDYYKIIADLDVFISYFALMDYVLEHHNVDKVLNLYNNQNYNRYLFKKNESLILLLLRRFYFQKMQEISLLDDITITLEELHIALNETGIVDKRLNKGEFKEIFRVLKRYNIIDISSTNLDDSTIIIIYPTILYALPIEKIETIDNMIDDYQRRGEIVEETSED